MKLGGMRRIASLAILATLAWLVADPVLAQEAKPTLDKGDTAWMLTSTVLVLLMIIPGLALFYGGLVRTKNMLSLLTQVLAVTCVVAIVWALYGYSYAFTESTPWIGDASKALLKGITPESLQGTIPELVFVFFQMTFAAITTALVLGGVVERVKFFAILLFAILWVPSCTSRSLTWSGAPAASWPTWARKTLPAAPWSTSTPALPRWSARSSSANASATARKRCLPTR